MKMKLPTPRGKKPLALFDSYQEAVEALVGEKEKKSTELLTEILPERPDRVIH
jgi:hypothetical protein